MEANYVHKDSTTLVQDKLVKNELNQIELQYNALKQQKFNELLKENEELKQQIIIMEKYFELIHNISFDYDGYNDVTGLKGVINELNRFSNLGRACNITEPIYEREGVKFNILLQKLSEQKTGDDK